MAKAKTAPRKLNAPGRPYPKMFVREVIAFAKKVGSCVKASVEFGVHVNTIRAWMRKAGKK